MGDLDSKIIDACRSALLRKMEKLTDGRVNDAVKLAFLDSEQLGVIDGLDLSALTEFKRNGNGAVEIKLTDRMAALERLLALTEQGKEEKIQALFQALEETAEKEQAFVRDDGNLARERSSSIQPERACLKDVR